MTVTRALLLGLFAFIFNSPLRGSRFNVVATRPLVIAFVIGLIMGDMKSAMIIGSVIQAAYIGIVFVGGFSSMPQITISQWFAIPIAITQGGDAEFALTICLAFSAVEQLFRTATNNLNLIQMAWADSLIHNGKLKAGYWVYYSSNVWNFLKFMIIIPIACLAGSSIISTVIEALPPLILNIMTIFVGICPLIGFGLLLNSLVNKSAQLIFFVLGFTLFKVIGLDIITITIIGIALAYILYSCSQNNTVEMEV